MLYRLNDHIRWAGYHVDVDIGVGFIGKKVHMPRWQCGTKHRHFRCWWEVSLWVTDKEDVAVMSSGSLLQSFKEEVESFH